MNTSLDGILAFAIALSLIVIVAAMGFAFYRMAKGPTLPDRVIALDLLGVLMVAFAAVYAVASGDPAFLDVGIGFALVAFLSTVAFARYAERRNDPQARRIIAGEPPSADETETRIAP